MWQLIQYYQLSKLEESIITNQLFRINGMREYYNFSEEILGDSKILISELAEMKYDRKKFITLLSSSPIIRKYTFKSDYEATVFSSIMYERWRKVLPNFSFLKDDHLVLSSLISNSVCCSLGKRTNMTITKFECDDIFFLLGPTIDPISININWMIQMDESDGIVSLEKKSFSKVCNYRLDSNRDEERIFIRNIFTEREIAEIPVIK
jgi:hypothetical protein